MIALDELKKLPIEERMQIVEAFDWNERQQTGLGNRFFNALKGSLDLAKA